MIQLAQINFAKLPLELKEEADKLGGAYPNKHEFLKALIEGYKESKQDKEEIELDTSIYKAVDDKSKEDIQHLFGHLLSVLDNNFMSIKTEALTLKKQKIATDIFIGKMAQNHLDEKAIFEEELTSLYLKKEEDFKLLLAENEELTTEAEEKSKKLESENKKMINELKLLKSEKEEALKNLEISRKLVKIGEEQDFKIIELAKELSKKDSNIMELTKELSKKDRKFDRVEYRVENLEKDISELLDESTVSSKTIRKQETTIAVQAKEIEWLQKKL